MYASHRDACILSYYAAELARVLDLRYGTCGLDDAVIAYRKLGKSNYDFAARALLFAQDHAPCVVLCFDVTGFFDNLDHRLLKARLTEVLGEKALPDDWYAVLKAVTKYRHVAIADLKAHPKYAERLKEKTRAPLASVAEIVRDGVTISSNGCAKGIPQGTPISAALSNVYMWDLDVAMSAACASSGALYQRYSDDILLVCPVEAEETLTDQLKSALADLKLQIKDEKTDRAVFDPTDEKTVQYLGFDLSPRGATLRPSSLARQWRKAKRAIRRTRKTGEQAIADGKANKIYTKKLRQRFLPTGVRNFSSYARRSAAALKSDRIKRQALRLERMVEAALRDIDLRR